jgi:ribosomal protein S13
MKALLVQNSCRNILNDSAIVEALVSNGFLVRREEPVNGVDFRAITGLPGTGASKAKAVFDIRQIDAALQLKEVDEAPLRKLSGLRASALVSADYRREIAHLLTALVFRLDDEPLETLRPYLEDELRGHPDYTLTDAIYKATHFAGEVADLLGAFYGTTNPLVAALALRGSMTVSFKTARGQEPANSNATTAEQQAQTEAAKRDAVRAFRLIDLYLDALTPLTAAFDADPQDYVGLAKAAFAILQTVTRIERLRFNVRCKKPLALSLKERKLGYIPGLDPKRQWLFKVRKLATTGKYAEALKILNDLPKDWRVIGKKDTWFAMTLPYTKAVLEHIVTGKPSWNHEHALWSEIVDTRGIAA